MKLRIIECLFAEIQPKPPFSLSPYTVACLRVSFPCKWRTQTVRA